MKQLRKSKILQIINILIRFNLVKECQEASCRETLMNLLRHSLYI